MKIVKDNEIIDPPLNQTNRCRKFLYYQWMVW